MIEQFFIWLLGPTLSKVALVLGTIFTFLLFMFSLVHRAAEERWPWEKKP